jgi:DNA-binding transcriptional LysR family regulator
LQIWKYRMDRLRILEGFVAVADSRGFSRAARQLQVSPASVTRAVAQLEEQLGVRLVARTTRHVSLTEAGVAYAESARRALAELDAAGRAATGESAMPTGTLTVSASVTFGRIAVAPVALDFAARHPRELRTHSLVRFIALMPGREWQYVEDGRVRVIE